MRRGILNSDGAAMRAVGDVHRRKVHTRAVPVTLLRSRPGPTHPCGPSGVVTPCCVSGESSCLLSFFRPPLGIFIALSLAACHLTPPPEPIIKTVEVRIPTPVPCPAMVNRPAFADEDLPSATDIFDAARKAKIGLLQRQDYENGLEAELRACAGK